MARSMARHPAETDLSTGIFEQNRRRLTGIAYGMLGSLMDAEDVVQEVYLRWARVDLAAVDTPGSVSHDDDDETGDQPSPLGSQSA
jgi:DNA-directed RNA polymerase specialized sigma24 family protein